MSWDKNPPLEPVFALDTLRNRVNTILKSNQKRNNTQEGDYRETAFWKNQVGGFYEEDSDISELGWLSLASRSPAFDFLKEPEEDIYNLESGEWLNKRATTRSRIF